jgi:hypothetical protein
MDEGRLHLKLSGLHGAYFALRLVEHHSTARVLALHWSVRRQMAACRIETADDIDAILEAAGWARDLDPHFTHQGPGSFCDLASKALEAIRRRRAEQELTADRLLQDVLRRATRTHG